MSEFPRTEVGGLSLSRMIIGTNWFLGYSHQTLAKDRFLKLYQDAAKIADVLMVYLEYGIDTLMGWHGVNPVMVQAIDEAQQRAGRRFIIIDTPGLVVGPQGVDFDQSAAILDQSAGLGSDLLLPHQSTTDALLDRTTRSFRQMDRVCAMIRERGMIPGLSTHAPESPTYADESGLDVETYIQIYNALGFLMQVEVDWVHRIIHGAAKPVICDQADGGGPPPPARRPCLLLEHHPRLRHGHRRRHDARRSPRRHRAVAFDPRTTRAPA